MSRPNILFVVTHDTGRRVGGYQPGISTPVLEQLAADGVRFNQCFCTAPQCSPSRASAITGLAPHSNGMIGLAHRGFRLHPEVRTLPMVLGDAGYDTWLFGGQHEAADGKDLGYAHVVPGVPRVWACEDVTPKVVEFLEHPPQQPFLAAVGFFETHRPFSDSGDAPTDGVAVPPWLPDVPEVRRDLADFDLDLAKVDRAVGAMLAALDRAGLAEHTLVVYTTDHGIAFPGAKGTLFDPGLGIASIWRGPGFTGGREVDALVQNIDYLPTFCELAGVEAPPVHGRSLLPLVRGEVETLHDELFVEVTYHAAYDPLRGVRTRTHKYIRSYEYRPYWFPPNTDDGYSKRYYHESWQFRQVRPRELLFDLVADPLEQHNLARDPAHRAVLNDLRARLDTHMTATVDPLCGGVVGVPPGAVITPPTNWEPLETPE